MEQWHSRDDASRLPGYPSDLELAPGIRDGLHVRVEIKSAISAYDVVGLAGQVDLCSQVTSCGPQRRLIISPDVEPGTRAAAPPPHRSTRIRHRLTLD